MAKKNPVSLGGIQGAMMPEEKVSEEMLFASQIAFDNSQQNQVIGKSVIYKLLDTNIKGNYGLILIDDVRARTGTGNERIRVLRGVDTIWQKDQKDIPPDYIKSNKRMLWFQKGNAFVEETDTQVLEFMEICNSNIDNPRPAQRRNTKFFKWNPAKQAEEQAKRDDFEINAILTAKGVEDMEEVKQHASFLGIPFVDGLGEPLSPVGIKSAYIRYAKMNPKGFMESYQSKEVKISYLVKRAIIDGKIDTGRGNNSIYWSSGGLIGKLPISQTPQEYLVGLAMNQNSEEGRAFLENLQQRIT